MPKNRDFAPLDPLPATWTDSLEEFVSPMAEGFAIIVKPGASGTVLQVPIPVGQDQVTVGMNGRWRWIRSPIERAVPTGAARSLDLWLTASDSVFAGGSPGEVDNTDYAFALVITETGAEPSGASLSRFVGRASWDGAKVTAIDMVVGAASGTARHTATHATGGSDPITPAQIGAATPAQVGAAVAQEAADRQAADNAESTARTNADTTERNQRIAADAAIAGDARWTDSRRARVPQAAGTYGGATGATQNVGAGRFLFMVSASARSNISQGVAARIGLIVTLDGQDVALTETLYLGPSQGSPVTFPMAFFLATITAGNHTVRLRNGNLTATVDDNDRFSLAMVEIA